MSYSSMNVDGTASARSGEGKKMNRGIVVLGVMLMAAAMVAAIHLRNTEAEVEHRTALATSPNCACPKIYAPVCGADGKTYPNACVAGCSSVKVACNGKCPCPGKCPAGKYYTSGACHDCPAGYSCNADKKTICAAGYFQASTGKSSCQKAACGKFVPAPGGTMELTCRAGTYSAAGASSCKPTPAGTYSGAGACKPTPCPKGTYQDCEGQSNCPKGPCGHFVDKTGATGFTPCPAGTYQPLGGQSSCLPVGPGQYSGVGHCKPRVCIPGYYQDLPGQKSCKPADCGKKVPNPGSNNQVSCGKGYYQPQPGQPNCIPIPAGYISAKGGCAIVCCPPGKFRNSNFVCEPAPCGSFVPTPCSSAPTKCPPGTYTATGGASVCVKAPKGSIPNANQCGTQKCPPGQYQNLEGQTKCKDAQCGYKAPNPGTVNPVPCPMGYFQDSVKSTTCKPCPAGSANNKVAQCHCPLCLKGHYQPKPAQTTCIPSPCGNFVPGKGATKVNPCPPGEYQDKTGQSGCVKAPAGKYAVGGTCKPGTCPPGTFTPTTGLTKCTEAPCGTFVATAGSTGATPCVAGEYQPLPGQTQCLDTPTGSYTSGSGKCAETLCKPGNYQPQTGQKNCLPAKCGHYVAITGSAHQNPCGPGRYQPLPGKTSCLQADLGYFVKGNAACKQERCPAGTYTDCKGQSGCNLAPCGSFVSGTGGKKTTPCPAGTYQDTAGQASCKTNPAGTFSQVGFCKAQQCDPGYYQPMKGQAVCKGADCGHFVDGEGRTSQTQCPTKTYQPKTNQVGCLQTTLALAPNPGMCTPGVSWVVPCKSRPKTGDDRWVTYRKYSGITPTDISNHKNADLIIEGKRICRYRIRWFSGSWSQWYVPGVNDNVNTGKNDVVWNPASFAAGRRQWSMFADHTHEICYCKQKCAEGAFEGVSAAKCPQLGAASGALHSRLVYNGPGSRTFTQCSAKICKAQNAITFGSNLFLDTEVHCGSSGIPVVIDTTPSLCTTLGGQYVGVNCEKLAFCAHGRYFFAPASGGCDFWGITYMRESDCLNLGGVINANTVPPSAIVYCHFDVCKV